MSPPPQGERGAIKTFTDAAARRLKEWFMTKFVPGFQLCAFTFTTHRPFSEQEWRALMKRFRMRCVAKGWAGVWRAELQRRKAPHAHVALWIPPDLDPGEVAEEWLAASQEAHDVDARAHAVRWQRIAADEAGWAVYMALHNGSAKKAQLGWLGKQWGVWNRELFAEREPQELTLSESEHAMFLRVLRHLESAARRTLANNLTAALADICWRYARGLSNLHPNVVWRKIKRLRRSVRPLHRGNLLRCMKGEQAALIIRAIRSGEIGRMGLRSTLAK